MLGVPASRRARSLPCNTPAFPSRSSPGFLGALDLLQRPEWQRRAARKSLRETFRREIARREIDGVEVRAGVVAVAIVGLGMAATPASPPARSRHSRRRHQRRGDRAGVVGIELSVVVDARQSAAAQRACTPPSSSTRLSADQSPGVRRVRPRVLRDRSPVAMRMRGLLEVRHDHSGASLSGARCASCSTPVVVRRTAHSCRRVALPRDGAPYRGDDVVTYPEGNTPLLRRPAVTAWASVADDLLLKHEGHNPTGSFKDRA